MLLCFFLHNQNVLLFSMFMVVKHILYTMPTVLNSIAIRKEGLRNCSGVL